MPIMTNYNVSKTAADEAVKALNKAIGLLDAIRSPEEIAPTFQRVKVLASYAAKRVSTIPFLRGSYTDLLREILGATYYGEAFTQKDVTSVRNEIAAMVNRINQTMADILQDRGRASTTANDLVATLRTALEKQSPQHKYDAIDLLGRLNGENSNPRIQAALERLSAILRFSAVGDFQSVRGALRLAQYIQANWEK